MSQLTEHQQRWVDALRSGEYEQCEGALRRGDKYCCLGVACDLFKEELEEEWRELARLPSHHSKNPRETRYSFRNYEGVLAPAVIKLLGLVSGEGHAKGWPNSYPYPSLTSLNDRGVPFSAIADQIESGVYFKHPPKEEV